MSTDLKTSIVYRHILFYRGAMNLLYAGRYRQRFEALFPLLAESTRSVCDLCFGDTVLADWCDAHAIQWTGIDVNAHFCARAEKRGHRVLEGDVLSADLPTADAYVMAGSLYHFHEQLDGLFDRVFDHTRRFVLSEPVVNLSDAGGIVGRLARRSANPGVGHAPFRFNEGSLRQALQKQSTRLALSFRVHSVNRDLVAELWRP